MRVGGIPIDPNCPGCAALRKELAAVKARLALLEERLAGLAQKASRNSSNSSQAPSTDLKRKKRRTREHEGPSRNPGGQPGHSKAERDIVPPEDVDETIHCIPTHCGRCGVELHGEDPEPLLHQVTEIPPVAAYVTNVWQHARGCACGATTLGALPPGVPSGCFGPRLQATIATLTGVYRMSRRNVQAFLADSFGLKISLGAISKQESIVSMALLDPMREALQNVLDADVVNADETSWRESGVRTWLWTGVTDLVTAFIIRPTRGSVVAQELLGDNPERVVVVDRCPSYFWIDESHRQVCWAHLDRDFKRISEVEGLAGQVGKGLLKCADKLFKSWGRVRDGTHSRERLKVDVARLRKRVHSLLKTGKSSGDKATEGTCRALLKHEQSLWVFADHEGVEPTNNAAERAIRPAVLLRKCSLGTQSRRGSLFVERMQTITGTLRKQGRAVFGFVHAAVVAHLLGKPAPSLLPTQR